MPAGRHQQTRDQATVPVDRAGVGRSPGHRRCSGPLRPVQVPSASRSWVRWCRPKPARGARVIRTSAAPSTAMTRRSRTARCGSPGNARASRHSMMPWLVTQRLRQISCPLRSSRPRRTGPRGDGVTAGAAEERSEDGVAVPAGRAHPDDVAARPEQGAAFPVGQQRVVPQHLRREPVRAGVRIRLRAVTGAPRGGSGRRRRRRCRRPRRWSAPPAGSGARSPPPRPCWWRAARRPQAADQQRWCRADQHRRALQQLPPTQDPHHGRVRRGAGRR